jgi:hypothetical protein
MLGSLLLPGIIAGILTWKSRGRLPLALLSVGLLIVIVLNPAKGEYRRLAWSREKVTFVESISLWGEAAERTWTAEKNGADLNTGIASAARRMNALCQVGQVYDWVPLRIPHAGWERWLGAPLLLIPRVFWPSKPIVDTYYNRDYTHTFHLQKRRGATGTSITLPIIGDGYWRIGWFGVLLEGILWGTYMGLAQGISRVRSVATLLCAFALLQLRPENHAVGSFSGTLQRVLAALFIAWLVRTLSSQQVSASALKTAMPIRN